MLPHTHQSRRLGVRRVSSCVRVTGFPFPGKELTSDYNPLEAGLWHSVHFDKVSCFRSVRGVHLKAFNDVCIDSRRRE